MGQKKDTKNFNPFPGLRPFATEDSDIFFGRESESDEVILKLLNNRYTTVVGSSGNGKSSLICSGVLPKIIKMKVGQSSVWRVISLRPGDDPFGNTALAIENGITDPGQKSIDRGVILSELLNNPVSFSDVVRKYMIKHDDNILLVIDQFEDLFRYNSPDEAETKNENAKKFVDFILNSVITPDVNIFIIIALRSEYLGECSYFKGLTMLINNSNYLVPVIAPENYKELIERPVIYAGAKIDPDLIEKVLIDIKKQTYQLPVLQHVMMRTWSHWQKADQPDKPIGLEDYALIGTMDNALSIHADEAYDELNQQGKEICASMFKVITRKDRNIKSMSHPCDIGTIKLLAGCTDAEIFSVIEKFRSQSRSFIIPPVDSVLNENTFVDLQNECLIRYWRRLRNWIDDEASSRELYLRLSEASALYQQGKTGLLRSPDLEPVIAWRDQHKPTLNWAVQYNPAFERAMVYLRTSEKSFLIEEKNKEILQSRKIKRNRFITRMLSTVILIVAGFLLFTYVQKLTAERHIVLAEKQRIEAEKGKSLADSFAVIVLEQKIVSDSTANANVRDAEEARKQTVVADLQKSIAERKAAEALHQKNLAVQKSDSLREVSLRAAQNSKLAVEQRDETRRLRMLSIGKSMSLKSLQLSDQKDLQTLLAYQAYLFNKRNNGPQNDADIYAGLYNAGLQYSNINYRSFKGHSGAIKSIAFLPGKNEFFTSGNDGQVLKWSLDKKDQTLQVMYSGSDIIDALAVSPDASWLACGSSNSSIKMIPLKGNTGGYEMTGHKGGIKSLIFSYDGKYLYSAAIDGKVLKWDIAAKTSINVATGSMEITSIDISSNGNYLAGLSTDGKVVVWNQKQKSENFRIETAGKNIKVVRFNPDNNLLAIGDADGTLELWDINLRKKISEVKAHEGQINDIQFNTALKQMATSGNDKKLKIYNISDPSDLTQPPVTLADNEGFVLVMKFSPDGQMIVSGESGGGKNIISRPSNADNMVADICNQLTRNMTQDEWNVYVARDIPLEKTCQSNNLNIKIEPIKSLNK
jgi:WD40 repeat protein